MDFYFSLVFLLSTFVASLATAIIAHEAFFVMDGLMGSFVLLGLSAFWMLYSHFFLNWRGY